jgi:hypothetical protein
MRLRRELSLDLEIDDEALGKAHEDWSEWFFEVYAQIAGKMDYQRIVVDGSNIEIDKLVRLTTLKYSIRFLCYQLCAKQVVCDLRQIDIIFSNTLLETIRQYKSELFSIYLSYELYRNFKARWFGRVDLALFRLLPLSEVLTLCGRLKRPLDFDSVFDQLIPAAG